MSANPFSEFGNQPAAGVYDPATYRLPPRKPGALTAVAVMALVLGILGMLVSCMSVATLPFQSQLQNLNTAGSKVQVEMNQAIAKVQNRYLAGTMSFAVLHLVVATCLVIGGVMVLQGKPSGRTFLLYTLLAVIVFEILRTILVLVIQLECLPVIDGYMDKLGEDPAAGGGRTLGPGFARMMKGFMIFGLVVAMVWPLIKVIVYAISARYLSSPRMVEFFANRSASSPQSPA
jgi:hypothetical protein